MRIERGVIDIPGLDCLLNNNSAKSNQQQSHPMLV